MSPSFGSSARARPRACARVLCVCVCVYIYMITKLYYLMTRDCWLDAPCDRCSSIIGSSGRGRVAPTIIIDHGGGSMVHRNEYEQKIVGKIKNNNNSNIILSTISLSPRVTPIILVCRGVDGVVELVVFDANSYYCDGH